MRTVDVLPPSAADEAGWVFLAAGFVILGVIYVFAFERYGWSGSPASAGAGNAGLPFQVLFRDLPGNEQRLIRAMQEGGIEAVRLRGESGGWPSVEALAAAGIPPFARDVLDKAGYGWTERRAGLVVNYLGVAAAPASAPALLILIQEPDPVTGEKPPPPSVVDEEHQLLADGTLLHVTYWKRAASNLPAGAIIDPAMEGWQQVRSKSLFEEAAER